MDSGRWLLGITESGTAVWCSACGRVEIALGNALLSLDRDELSPVIRAVADLEHDEFLELPYRQRRVVLRLHQDKGAFLFNRAEMGELKKLLDDAELGMRDGPPGGPPRVSASDPLIH